MSQDRMRAAVAQADLIESTKPDDMLWRHSDIWDAKPASRQYARPDSVMKASRRRGYILMALTVLAAIAGAVAVATLRGVA